MTHKTIVNSLEYQLRTWKPFQLQTLITRTTTLDTASDLTTTPPNGCKRPCFFDRSFSIDSLDMSKLTLLEEEITTSRKREKLWIARKRRRRGSRSVSGRSSDKSGTRRLSVGPSAAYATCSDFPVAAGTDSSGELFVNGGDASWSSDVSEAAKNSRRESGGAVGEKEGLLGPSGFWQIGGGGELLQGNESGYGSEPGYRGDAELGYGDEFDEEEDDEFGDTDCDMEIVGGDNTFAEKKAHHRCRRKKQHDWRMVGISG